MKHSKKKEDQVSTSLCKPVCSMTGFGKAQVSFDGVTVEMELRSVNSRFLDLNFKLPRVYNEFEPALRKILSATLQRGRVEVYVQRNATNGAAGAIGFNRNLFQQYLALYEDQAKSHSALTKDFLAEATLRILDRRDVLEASEAIADISAEQQAVESVCNQALEGLQAMREAEGALIFADIEARFVTVQEIATAIEGLSTGSTQVRYSQLQARIQDLLQDVSVSEERLLAEVAILADKSDVTEEIVRINSHCQQWGTIRDERPVGRKLEFLLQELGREFNTVASKTQASEVQKYVVEAKSCLEKLREQAANLE